MCVCVCVCTSMPRVLFSTFFFFLHIFFLFHFFFGSCSLRSLFSSVEWQHKEKIDVRISPAENGILRCNCNGTHDVQTTRSCARWRQRRRRRRHHHHHCHHCRRRWRYRRWQAYAQRDTVIPSVHRRLNVVCRLARRIRSTTSNMYRKKHEEYFRLR